MSLTLTNPSLRLVIWNDSSTEFLNFKNEVSAIKFHSVSGSTSGETVNFVVSNNNDSRGETFNSVGNICITTDGSGPTFSSGSGVTGNNALLVYVESGNTLEIKNTDSSNALTLDFGGTNALTIAASKAITIQQGSTLFIGGYFAKLNSRGLDSNNQSIATTYTSEYVSIGGPGILTVNKNLVLSGDTKIHIGRTVINRSGANFYKDSLTISSTSIFTNTRLNIGSDGAAGDCVVTCSGSSGDIAISESIINVGGGKGTTRGNGVGGAGGKGELTISANVSKYIAVLVVAVALMMEVIWEMVVLEVMEL